MLHSSFINKLASIGYSLLRALFGVFVFLALMNMIFYLFARAGINIITYEGTCNFLYGIIAVPAVLFYIRLTENSYQGTDSSYSRGRVAGGRFTLLRHRAINASQVMLLVIISLGMLGMVSIFISYIASLAERSTEVATVLEDYSQSTDRFSGIEEIHIIPKYDYILNLIGVSVFIPLAEELVFRGIVFGELRRSMHPAFALVISSIVFGVLHGNGLHIIYAAICGLILGATYWFCDSLLACFLVHAIFNLLGSGLPTLFDGSLFDNASGVVAQVINMIENLLFYIEYMMMPPALVSLVFLGMIYRDRISRVGRSSGEETASELDPIPEETKYEQT